MAEDINRLVPELPRLLDVQQFVGAREAEVCMADASTFWSPIPNRPTHLLPYWTPLM